MSVFGDFQQVWLQRFPDSPLPGAWEEDVRANLARHKQKVQLLEEELEKEKFYVEYLERLLNDVEQHKLRVSKEKPEENQDQPSDVTPDTALSKEETRTPPPTPIKTEETEAFSANMCVNEISNMAKSVEDTSDPSAPPEQDPGSFVTIIEVNEKQNQSPSPVKKVPPKLPVRPESLKNIHKAKINRSNSESVSSSSEFLANEENYYDTVASEDEYNLVKSNHSSSENLFSTSSTLPLSAKRESTQTLQEPQSPGTSNYVNIEYFIQKKKNGNGHSSSDEEHEEVTELRRNVTDNGSYASSSSLESLTPASRRKFLQEANQKNENEKPSMYKCIVHNIIESETNYVEWLSVLLQYRKAIQATVNTSQPIVTETELVTIFYKIPELHALHANFLEALKRHTTTWENIGPSFKTMASNLALYGAFLSNYGRALDAVRKCSAANSQFSEITKSITCKRLSEQPISLEELLHKPVAKVQNNALILHDLLKCIPQNKPDFHSISEALHLTQQFLDQFNIIQTKSMFPTDDRAQRRLVKNSFIVEKVDGSRKLRHLFLFNDVIACAKYKSCGRTEKYTFELKWFIPVEVIQILEEVTPNFHETDPTEIIELKSQASNVRDQLRQEEKALEEKKMKMSRGSDKFRKRLLELESQLVLVSPNLIFRIKPKMTNKIFQFYLSSDFERTQWIEAIQTLQRTAKPPTPATNFNMLELQSWISACRAYLKTNMGSYLLRSGQDESLLIGDLYVQIYDISGLEYACELYVLIEVDFYGHFFQKAKTKIKSLSNTSAPPWNENFIIDLEGCENMRILVYRVGSSSSQDSLFGKFTLKLSRKWLGPSIVEKNLYISGAQLRIGLKFNPCEVSLRRIPTGKSGSLFGEKFQVVCKRQKRNIPFIITACIREVERRGMSEVGIYRLSGSVLDIPKLKKAFETNSYEAEQRLKEVDIHSVTGILKLYLRELPEALFTDQLYPILLEAFNQSNNKFMRRIELLKEVFARLPESNKETINYILDHLIRVYKHESENKMSLHNLATVFGPTLLRHSAKADGKHKDNNLEAGTVDVMSQAGILYCYLQDRSSPST